MMVPTRLCDNESKRKDSDVTDISWGESLVGILTFRAVIFAALRYEYGRFTVYLTKLIETMVAVVIPSENLTNDLRVSSY